MLYLYLQTTQTSTMLCEVIWCKKFEVFFMVNIWILGYAM